MILGLPSRITETLGLVLASSSTSILSPIVQPRSDSQQTTNFWCRNYSRDLRLAKWGSGVSLHGSNPERLMSAMGQKRTLRGVRPMSAIPPKADIAESDWHVRFVPIPEKNATHVTRSAARRNPSKGLTNTVGIGGHPLRPEQA